MTKVEPLFIEDAKTGRTIARADYSPFNDSVIVTSLTSPPQHPPMRYHNVSDRNDDVATPERGMQMAANMYRDYLTLTNESSLPVENRADPVPALEKHTVSVGNPNEIDD